MTSAPGPARTVATVERIPPLRSRRGASVWLSLALTSYLAMATAAASAGGPTFLAAVVVVAAVEGVLPHRAAVIEWALQRVGLGIGSRALLRGLLLLLFAARTSSTAVTVATAGTVIAVTTAHALRQGLAQVVTYFRRPPVLSRGLPLEPLSIPKAPPRLLLEPRGLAAIVDLPAAAGLALAATGSAGTVAVGLAVAALSAAASPVLLAAHVVALHRRDARAGVAREVARRLAELRPEVVLYFAGDSAWRYQIEMWLEPVEQLQRRSVVVVRDHDLLESLAPTSLPVISVPNGSALTSLELGEARVVLYVANTGENIHMLRHRSASSVFIGHGDSDKAASTNPFTRVYDEIWVAGPAGRDRFLAAEIGVPNDRIVEVGRPQLATVARRGTRPAGTPVTVLYAPTWEGWGDDRYHTSLPHVGAELVRALLERPGVRVLYRPHPLTGSRDEGVRRAHADVVRLLRAAGALGPEASPGGPPGTGRSQSSLDVLDLARKSRQAAGWTRAEHRAQLDGWTREYWSCAPAGRHRILTAPAPDLFSCLAMADVLVSDVSSVTTDFLAVDRPYAVVNARGLPGDEFRARYPSAVGGFLIGPHLEGLEPLIKAADGVDPSATARRATRERLLGADDPGHLTLFRSAVDRLCDLGVPGEHAVRMGAR